MECWQCLKKTGDIPVYNQFNPPLIEQNKKEQLRHRRTYRIVSQAMAYVS